MTFNGKKAIYLQIADVICDKILLGEIAETKRVPSVRETAAMVEVNINTVMRAYDYLQNQQVIFTKRGLGYFVSEGAKEVIHAMRKQEFIEESVPEIAHNLATLGISVEELVKLLKHAKS